MPLRPPCLNAVGWRDVAGAGSVLGDATFHIEEHVSHSLDTIAIDIIHTSLPFPKLLSSELHCFRFVGFIYLFIFVSIIAWFQLDLRYEFKKIQEVYLFQPLINLSLFVTEPKNNTPKMKWLLWTFDYSSERKLFGQSECQRCWTKFTEAQMWLIFTYFLFLFSFLCTPK